MLQMSLEVKQQGMQISWAENMCTTVAQERLTAYLPHAKCFPHRLSPYKDDFTPQPHCVPKQVQKEYQGECHTGPKRFPVLQIARLVMLVSTSLDVNLQTGLVTLF